MNKTNITKRSTKTAKSNRAARPARPKRRRRTRGIVFNFDELFELFSRQEALLHQRRRRDRRKPRA